MRNKRSKKWMKDYMKADEDSTDLIDSDECYEVYSVVVNFYVDQGVNTLAPTATSTETPVPTQSIEVVPRVKKENIRESQIEG
jgi:hypothetical protein